MAGRGPQTFKKKQKEQQRKEKREEKMAKRLERKKNPLPLDDTDVDLDQPAPIAGDDEKAVDA
jgi:hypothetical protein